MTGLRLNALKALAIGILLTGQVFGDTILTILGTGEPGFSGDGEPAIEAQIRGPFGVTRGPDGCLYLCDTYNHCIRKIDKVGIVSAVAGIGGKKGYHGDGGQALKALLNEPYEVRFDKKGDLYFVEMMNHLIRKVNMRTGVITTVAGTGKKGFDGDGGPATKAKFNRPHSIQFGPEGDLYACDIGNHLIRKISMQTGRVSTFCGTGKRRKTRDGGRISEVDLERFITRLELERGAFPGTVGRLGLRPCQDQRVSLWGQGGISTLRIRRATRCA
jgi:streptogramin lyase